MRVFGEFTKTERRPDGTLIVSGICSTESRDSDNEKILASAMRAAIPPFFRSGPAVREQHDPQRAVGTGISMEVDSEGRTHFECLVVDPVTIAKITSKPPVLRGFSVGGRVPPNGRDPRDPSIITALHLSEVSLVDRPAQAEAVVTMWKADDTTGRRPSPSTQGRPDDDRAESGHSVDAPLCLKCGDPLACPACEPEGDSEKVSKLASTVSGFAKRISGLANRLGMAHEARDEALAKLAHAEASALAKIARVEADALAKVRAARLERDTLAKRLRDTEVELAKRPKGSLRVFALSKADDVRGEVEPERVPDDARSLIKRAQRAPMAITGRDD